MSEMEVEWKLLLLVARKMMNNLNERAGTDLCWHCSNAGMMLQVRLIYSRKNTFSIFCFRNRSLLDLIIIMKMSVALKRKEQMAECLFYLWEKSWEGWLVCGGSLAVELYGVEVKPTSMVMLSSFIFSFTFWFTKCYAWGAAVIHKWLPSCWNVKLTEEHSQTFQGRQPCTFIGPPLAWKTV